MGKSDKHKAEAFIFIPGQRPFDGAWAAADWCNWKRFCVFDSCWACIELYKAVFIRYSVLLSPWAFSNKSLVTIILIGFWITGYISTTRLSNFYTQNKNIERDFWEVNTPCPLSIPRVRGFFFSLTSNMWFRKMKYTILILGNLPPQAESL